MILIKRVVCGFVALGLCLAMTAPTLGDSWNGDGDGVSWSDGDNWVLNVVPAGGNTYIDGVYSVEVNTNIIPHGNYLNVRNGADLTINADLTAGDDFQLDNATATMNAGTFTCDEKFKFGNDGGTSQTFYMKGGTVTMTDDLEIKSGSVLEYSGGSFDCDVELEHRGGTIRMVGYDAAGLLEFDGMKDTSSSSIFEFVPNAAGQITPITNLGGSDGVGLVVNLDALTASATMMLFDASAAQDAFPSIAITKDATPLTLGTQGALNPGEYFLDYAGGSGTDVVLEVNVVPEPSSIVLLGAALLGVLGFVRRRRRA